MQDTPAFDRTKYGINYPYIYPAARTVPNKLPAIDYPGFQRLQRQPVSFATPPARSTTLNDNLTKIHNNHTLSSASPSSAPARTTTTRSTCRAFPAAPTTRTAVSSSATLVPAAPAWPSATRLSACSTTTPRSASASLHSLPRPHVRMVRAGSNGRPAHKLKIDLGVRHTIVQPYYSLWSNMTVFDPKYYDPAKAVQGGSRHRQPDRRARVIRTTASSSRAAAGRMRPRAACRSRTTGQFDSIVPCGEPRVLLQYRLRQLPAALRYRLPVDSEDGGPRRRRQVHHAPGRQRFGLPGRQPAACSRWPPCRSVRWTTPAAARWPASRSASRRRSRDFHMPQAYTWNLTVEHEADAQHRRRRQLCGTPRHLRAA